MGPHTLIAILAGNHDFARGLALALLETARAAPADDLHGLMNIDTNTFGSIAVWLDCAGADTWQAAHTAVSDGHVVFRNLESNGVLTKLIGAIEDEDRLEFFVDGEDKLWLVIATAKPTNF